MSSIATLTIQCFLLLFYLVHLATAIPSPDVLAHAARLRRTNPILESWRILRPPTRLALAANDATAQRVNITLSDGTGIVNGVKYPQWGIDAFLGMPFAQPPTGDLRFNKPQPLSQDSKRVIDASQYGVACVQVTVRLYQVLAQPNGKHIRLFVLLGGYRILLVLLEKTVFP